MKDDHIDSDIRAVYIWTSTLWLLDISGIRETTRRNVISEAIALMFFVLRNDVCKPRPLTSDPSEHNFGVFRSIIREFTVMQFIQLVKRTNQRIDAIFKGRFKTAKGRNKGYLFTLGSYIQSNIESISKYDYGPVKIDPNRTNIVTQILQEKVKIIMKKTTVTMLELPALTGIKK